MKVIETKGITYLEKFNANMEWYWGTDYACGDLYEAEEVFRDGKRFEPNRLIFVHYPDGRVFEPIEAKENQYFGRPAYIDGVIYILLVSFDKELIRIMKCSHEMKELSVIAEIPLSEVQDCYNLKIDGSPVMVTRQGGDNYFQIIWPIKVNFSIGERESFYLRKSEKLYFHEWHEDPEYREEINIREYPSGNMIEKISGAVMTMPNEENWILR